MMKTSLTCRKSISKISKSSKYTINKMDSKLDILFPFPSKLFKKIAYKTKSKQNVKSDKKINTAKYSISYVITSTKNYYI